MTLIDEAYQRAVEVLEACMDKKGMKASAFADGYPQVWARDSMITFLGASLIESDKFRECFRHSLLTLSRCQSDLGGIPTGVDTRRKELPKGGCGSMDNNPWYLIGHRVYQMAYGDDSLLSECRDNIQRAALWLRYQDRNEDGLLECHEAGDWADLLANRHHVLYANALYGAALRCAAGSLEDNSGAGLLKRESERTVDMLNLRLWIDNSDEQETRLRSLYGDWGMDFRSIRGVALKRDFYLPYVSFRDWGDYCDGLGNCLAILTGAADERRRHLILNYMHGAGMDLPYPIRVLDPPITEGSKDWREYYRNFNLNRPNQYHNGGIWPFIGGFYVAALVFDGRMEQAAMNLEKLAEANRLGSEPWAFNEWLHGLSGRPMGNRWQAWSAGMYVYAYHAVKEGKTPYFPLV